MRITKADLEVKEKRVNQLLKKIQLKIAGRYGYTAIDIYEGDRLRDTLISGLTKREAYNILDAIETILTLEL